MITIDFQNRKPIYEQIIDRFQVLIMKGILAPDSQMPSVRSLAVERGPTVGGVFFLNEGTVARQRLMKSCRVDLRRWDQVCDSFG